MDLLAKRKLPDDYANDVIEVLRLMSFTNLKGLSLMGSAELKAQLYAGDYDAYEVVNVPSVAWAVRKFQSMIRNLLKSPLTYIGDIKMGSIEEWKVIGDEATIKNGNVVGYKPQQIKKKLKALYEQRIISRQEWEDGDAMLKPSITPYQLLEIKRDLRFNILRWTPQEVLKGYKKLHDGRHFTLADAITSPTLSKMDCISWVQGNRYTEFSVIYEFYYKKRLLNGLIKNAELALKESTYQLYHERNFYKMAKRMFALARLQKQYGLLKVLSALFNGDLGRLYIVYGDIGTMEYMVENLRHLPAKRIHFEIDQFHNRLANITLPKYLQEQPQIMEIIDRIEKHTDLTKNKGQTLHLLRLLKERIMDLLSAYSYDYLYDCSLIPPPRIFLP